MSDITFADGMGLVDRKDNTPDFVLNKFYFNADKFSQFLQGHKSEKGWVYVDMLQSQKGSVYFKLNQPKPKEWKPAPQTQEQIDEVKNMPRIKYPEEEPEDSPF